MQSPSSPHCPPVSPLLPQDPSKPWQRCVVQGHGWLCVELLPVGPTELPQHLREELRGCWRRAVPFVSWLRDSPKDGAAPWQKGAGGTQRVSSQGASQR